jgi:hypothetical protein
MPIPSRRRDQSWQGAGFDHLGGADMSWRRLLEDVEAQAETADELALASEVADRTRRERASVTLVERLLAVIGAVVTLDVAGVGPRHGLLADVGPDWLLVVDPAAPDREQVVALSAVIAVRSAEAWAVPSSPSPSQRSQDLAWLLRRFARDRSTVRLHTVTGVWPGTIDRVGRDHLDLAVHDVDDTRRAANVRERAIVPLVQLVAVERC